MNITSSEQAYNFMLQEVTKIEIDDAEGFFESRKVHISNGNQTIDCNMSELMKEVRKNKNNLSDLDSNQLIHLKESINILSTKESKSKKWPEFLNVILGVFNSRNNEVQDAKSHISVALAYKLMLQPEAEIRIEGGRGIFQSRTVSISKGKQTISCSMSELMEEIKKSNEHLESLTAAKLTTLKNNLIELWALELKGTGKRKKEIDAQIDFVEGAITKRENESIIYNNLLTQEVIVNDSEIESAKKLFNNGKVIFSKLFLNSKDEICECKIKVKDGEKEANKILYILRRNVNETFTYSMLTK